MQVACCMEGAIVLQLLRIVQGAALGMVGMCKGLLCSVQNYMGLEHWWVTNRCGPSKTNAFRQDYVEIKSPGLKKSVGRQGPRGSKGRSTGSQGVKG